MQSVRDREVKRGLGIYVYFGLCLCGNLIKGNAVQMREIWNDDLVGWFQ